MSLNLDLASPASFQSALGFRVWRNRSFTLPVAHAHADVEVNFIISGEFTYLHGGQIATVTPFCFTAFWAGVPHCIVSSRGKPRGILLTLPLAWLLEWQLPNNIAARFFGGERLVSKPNEAELSLFERWVADFESGDKHRRHVLILEIEARFYRQALETQAGHNRKKRNQASPKTGLEQVERITEYIAQNFRDPITVEQIAKAVGLHGKYIMRLFKRRSGMSVWEYVTRMRLSHAQRLLLTTSRKIIDIALDAGFGSLGPFYRAFAAYSPGFKRPLDYRRNMGSMLKR